MTSYAPAGFVEPTRRLPFSARFSYDGRYGAALVAVVLGGYLLVNANVVPLALALGGRGGGSFAIEQSLFFGAQLLFAIAVILVGLAMAPATRGRRVIAVIVTLVLILIWFIMFTARISGSGPLPFASGFVTSLSFIVPLATATGWLIVRERPALSYLALLLAFLGGAIPFLLILNGAPSIFSQLVATPIAGLLGIGIAWVARAIAAAIHRVRAGDGLVDQPLAPV